MSKIKFAPITEQQEYLLDKSDPELFPDYLPHIPAIPSTTKAKRPWLYTNLFTKFLLALIIGIVIWIMSILLVAGLSSSPWNVVNVDGYNDITHEEKSKFWDYVKVSLHKKVIYDESGIVYDDVIGPLRRLPMGMGIVGFLLTGISIIYI